MRCGERSFANRARSWHNIAGRCASGPKVDGLTRATFPLNSTRPLDFIEPDIERADFEADPAIGQIIFPHPLEAEIESQGVDGRPGFQEPSMPFGERARVAVAEEFR